MYDNSADFRADLDDRAPGARARRKQATGAIPVPFKLPNVCRECNGGWMGRLEEAAKRLFPGLILGKRKYLAPFDQFIIGTWVMKTCLAYDAVLEPRLIPAHQGTRQLFSQGYPLPGAHIAVGFDSDHDPEGALLYRRNPHDDIAEPLGLDVKSISFSFQFDHLLLHAMINFGDDFSEHPDLGLRIPLESDRWEQVWPPIGRFLWPSDAALIRRDSPGPTDLAEPPMPNEPS